MSTIYTQTDDSWTDETRTEQLRQEAVSRLQKRSDFWMHFTAYLVVNATLVLAWWLMGARGLFWPVFPLIGWGTGVLFHALDVFRRPLSEQRIRREMQRLG